VAAVDIIRRSRRTHSIIPIRIPCSTIRTPTIPEHREEEEEEEEEDSTKHNGEDI
jgi:hypothetical protein